MNTTDSIHFKRLGILTIVAVYLVILAGSTVRASGAGMGCPDWPTCFGQWIPPTDESQLPADYHEIYAKRGYANTVFNPVKTWTEYANRLMGASTGLLILLTTFSARRFLKTDKTVFWLAVSALLLTGFQGWLGSAVVASNLRPIMITAHMVMALLIVGLLIYAITRSQRGQLEKIDASQLSPRVATALKVVLAMTLLQIAMGTQIRESVDMLSVAFEHNSRHLWREAFPLIFYVHRSFSSLILLANLWIVWQIFRHIPRGSLLFTAGIIPSVLIICAILSGVVLDRLGFPAFAQPIHLLLANLIFGAQFFLFTAYRYAHH